MTIRSKFDIGDLVYFWSTKQVKIIQGTIENIASYSVMGKEGINSNWTYYIKPSDPNIFFCEDAPEHLVFKEREDVFEFCMALTKGI